MKKIGILILLAIFGLPLCAQVSYDTVTATVTDVNSHPYANALLTASLVNAQGFSVSSAKTPNGQIYNAQPVRAVLDTTGSFSIGLVPNNILTPTGTQWKISISFPTDSSILIYQPAWIINYQTAITGNVDLSTQISALAQPINFVNLKTGQSTIQGTGSGCGVSTPCNYSQGGTNANTQSAAWTNLFGGAGVSSSCGVLTTSSGGALTCGGYTPLRPANNLSDVANAANALANLGGFSSAPIGSQYQFLFNNGSSYGASTVRTDSTGANLIVPGAATAASINGGIDAYQASGSSPDAKLNAATSAACGSSASTTNRVVDARHFGPTTQTLQGTVTLGCSGGGNIEYWFDTSTKWVPNSTSLNMFTFLAGAVVHFLHVDYSSVSGYSGTVLQASGQFIQPTGSATFDHLTIVGSSSNSTATDVSLVSAGNTADGIEFTKWYSPTLYGGLYCLRMAASSGSPAGFVNANEFYDAQFSDCVHGATIDTTGGGPVEGNYFFGYNYEDDQGVALDEISFLGSSGLNSRNFFSGVGLYDMTSGTPAGNTEIRAGSGTGPNMVQGGTWGGLLTDPGVTIQGYMEGTMFGNWGLGVGGSGTFTAPQFLASDLGYTLGSSGIQALYGDGTSTYIAAENTTTGRVYLKSNSRYAFLGADGGWYLPQVPGFTAGAGGDCGFDSTNGNFHCYSGTDNLVALFATSGITSGDCVEFLKSTNTWTLQDAGSACGSGGGGGPTLQTNSVNNSSQATLNMETSTVNSVGLTVTPSNPSGGIEKWEVTGSSYTGNSATASSAAKWTNARNLANNSVDGSANVNFANHVIEQGTSDSGFPNAQFLGALATGPLCNTTTTGILSACTVAGAGAGLTSGPTSGTTSGHVATFTGTAGQIQDSGTAISALAPLASPALTGTPTAPTQGSCASNTDIATGAYVAACASGFSNPMSTLGDTIYGGVSGVATRLAGPTAGAGTYFLIDVPTTTSAVAETWSAAATGTGAPVLATSPTLVTPNLGTPSAINLANATALPCGGMPALTGNVTSSAGSCGTTVAAAPLSAITGLGTGVGAALGVNTGSAGAFGVLIASGTAAMNTGTVASGACETVVTVSASGVATTDTITAGFNGDPTAVTGYGASATGAILTIYPYPTSGNVNFKVCNNTASSITPGALTLNWRVVR